jgi:hypothetical protein
MFLKLSAMCMSPGGQLRRGIFCRRLNRSADTEFAVCVVLSQFIRQHCVHLQNTCLHEVLVLWCLPVLTEFVVEAVHRKFGVNMF